MRIRQDRVGQRQVNLLERIARLKLLSVAAKSCFHGDRDEVLCSIFLATLELSTRGRIEVRQAERIGHIEPMSLDE